MGQFTKPAESIAQQIARLQARGIVIGDLAAAQHALEHISYYRLRAYWLPFEVDPTNPCHTILPGTTLETVLSLYDFDRRLRLLLLDGIEFIEVSARGSWAHHMAMTYGSHGYLDASHYPKRHKFQRNQDELEREVDRSQDIFIKHYKAKYNHPKMPPVWMVAETMSFGLLSKWQSSIGSRADRKAVARQSGLPEPVYMSFIHHLATVRNTCAHHSRVWNRHFAVTLTVPTHPGELAASVNQTAPAEVYNTLTLMAFVLRRIAPGSTWIRRVKDLISTHPSGDIAAMGFPADWLFRPIWT
jgi:abortive infection bacteriophage resistance protein